MRSRRLLAVVALAALLAAPAVTAQVFVEPVSREATLEPGVPVTITQTMTNPTARAFFVVSSASGNLSSHVEFDPNRFDLGANTERVVNVTLTAPADTQFEAGTVTLVFTFVDRETGDSFDRQVTLAVEVQREPLLLGLFENPLPPPFHQGWGMFAAELAAWAVIGFVVAFVFGRFVGGFVQRAHKQAKEEMAHKVQAPMWYLVFVLGLNFSWRLVPPTPIVVVLDRLNDAAAVLVGGFFLYRLVTAALVYYEDRFAGKTQTKVDDLLIPVLKKIAAALVVILVAVFMFQALGVDLSFLVAGGLVVGLVISMAAQDTLSNFFAGIFILIDQPFREGDELMLETGEVTRVDEIGLRTTKLFHFQNNQQIIMPNNDLATKRIVNMSYPELTYRIVLSVGVAYDSDLKKVQRLLMDVAKANEAVLKDERHEPVVYLKEFGDSSINFQLRVFVQNSRRRNPVITELNHAIKEAFDREGIEIPFPQRDVWFKNPIANAADGPAEA